MADYRAIAQALPKQEPEPSRWKAIAGYLSRSGDEIARGVKSIPDAAEHYWGQYGAPAVEFAASMLPGAGFVQGNQDARAAREAFQRGDYGQAAVSGLSSVGNTALEALGPVGHAAMAVGPALRKGQGALNDLERLYTTQALPAVRDIPAPEMVPYPQGAKIAMNKPLWEMYHGTSVPEDFTRFNPVSPTRRNGTDDEMAVFLSGTPAVADNYSGSVVNREGAGPRIIPVTLDPGKTELFNIPQMIRDDPQMQQALIEHHQNNGRLSPLADRGALHRADYGQRLVNLYQDLSPEELASAQVPYAQGAVGGAVRVARQRGLDSAVLRGFSEDGGADQVVVLTPGRVWNGLTGKLMYGMGGAGLTAAAISDLQDDPRNGL